MTKPRFTYIKKGEEIEIAAGNDWNKFYLKLGFEVGDPKNKRKFIKFDNVIMDKMGKLLSKAVGNDLFNTFERDKKKAKT